MKDELITLNHLLDRNSEQNWDLELQGRWLTITHTSERGEDDDVAIDINLLVEALTKGNS